MGLNALREQMKLNEEGPGLAGNKPLYKIVKGYDNLTKRVGDFAKDTYSKLPGVKQRRADRSARMKASARRAVLNFAAERNPGLLGPGGGYDRFAKSKSRGMLPPIGARASREPDVMSTGTLRYSYEKK